MNFFSSSTVMLTTPSIYSQHNAAAAREPGLQLDLRTLNIWTGTRETKKSK